MLGDWLLWLQEHLQYKKGKIFSMFPSKIYKKDLVMAPQGPTYMFKLFWTNVSSNLSASTITEWSKCIWYTFAPIFFLFLVFSSSGPPFSTDHFPESDSEESRMAEIGNFRRGQKWPVLSSGPYLLFSRQMRLFAGNYIIANFSSV